MTTHIRHLPKIDTDRRAFVLVAMLAIVWIALYNYLQPIADWFTYRLLQFSPDDPLGQSLNFFLYDVPKILLC